MAKHKIIPVILCGGSGTRLWPLSRKKTPKQFEKIIGDKCFLEIFCDCTLDVCEKRDVKGLYKKARNGLISNFTGIDAPYEIPKHPNLSINTSLLTVDESIVSIIEYLKKYHYIYDVSDIFKGLGGNTIDGVHANKYGNQKIAQKLYSLIFEEQKCILQHK